MRITSLAIALMLAGASISSSAIAADQAPAAKAMTSKAATSPEGALGTLKYARLHTNADGSSHWSDEVIKLAPVPGGTGLEGTLAVSRIGDVKGATFALLKAGVTEDWHIAPRRQFMVCMQGVVEVTASDGQKRRLIPGQFALLEDTTGKGHITHSAGPEDHIALAIPVPESFKAGQ